MTNYILEMRKLGPRPVTTFELNPGVRGFYKPYTSVIFFSLFCYPSVLKGNGDGRFEKYDLLMEEWKIQ